MLCTEKQYRLLNHSSFSHSEKIPVYTPPFKTWQRGIGAIIAR